MNNTFTKCFTIVILLMLNSLVGFAKKQDIITPAKKLIERQLGNNEKQIQYKHINPVNGLETFAVEAKNGILTLKGSSSVALCYAYHTYMKEACGAMKTWSGENINTSLTWPDYKIEKRSTPYKLRYFLNVCTFGYTTPFWDWKRWEKEIDWMALRGVNMPLATVASEAIAERVWLRMGLTKEEIREFFTAPAHLPWHRMGNLNTWDGPLSDNWQNTQIEMQHLIIDRMRELGMEPIAPAFAGFVPMAFAEKNKDIKFTHLTWGGFDNKYNAYVLPPDSHYFEEIGKLFIQEWEKEFGKNTYYLSDSFNEMELPIKKDDVEEKHKLLANYGESIYRSISAGNPDAVWVTQGWTFGYQHSFWNKESLTSLLSRVPNDKMIIIDLGNDYPKWVWNTEQTWKVHDGFYGKNWIFSYVPNFGGKTLMTGDLNMYATSSAEALNSKSKGNMIGFGSAPEGLENNEVVYELLADMGWTNNAINLDDWMKSYCVARYGSYPKPMKEAWNTLRSTVYSSLFSYPRFTWQTIVPDRRRPNKFNSDKEFLKAVEKFLSCANEMKNSKLYVNDAIELSAYYLATKADSIYIKALQEDDTGNFVSADKYLSQSVELLLNIDRLLESHNTCRLENWVQIARDRGSNNVEKDSFESNAKRLITTWGGIQEDYAARFWSGLIKDYYVPRLKMYFSNKRCEVDAWEENWIKTPWHNTTVAFDNPLDAAIKLVNESKNI